MLIYLIRPIYRRFTGPVNADPHSIISMAECVLTDTWPLSYTYWIPFLAFETILFVLASAKGIMSLREQELRFANFCGTHVMKAFEVLIRDSILYFMLCVSVFELFDGRAFFRWLCLCGGVRC